MNVVHMIHSVPPVVSLIIAAVLVAMSGIAVAASLHARKIARTIASVKTSQIAGATDSYVALEGTVKAINGQMLVGPLTHAACCWFHVRVEEYSSAGDSSSWSTLGEHSSGEPFLILDATGECAVYPDGAEVTPTDRSVWYGPTALPQDRNPPRGGPGDSVEGMLRIEGTPGRRFRYTEERIYVGDALYALGRFVRGVGSDDEDDDDVGTRQPRNPNPGSGDQKAAFKNGSWLGKDWFRELDRIVKETAVRRLLPTHSKQQPFLLSTTPREKFLEVNRGGSKAALFVAGLPLGLAVTFLWLRFG
jgi:hypothetical protein